MWPSSPAPEHRPDEAACLWQGLSHGLVTAQKGRKAQVEKPHELTAGGTPGLSQRGSRVGSPGLQKPTVSAALALDMFPMESEPNGAVNH